MSKPNAKGDVSKKQQSASKMSPTKKSSQSKSKPTPVKPKQSTSVSKKGNDESKSALIYMPGEIEHEILTDDPEYYERSIRVTKSYNRLKLSGLLDYVQIRTGENSRKCTKDEMLLCHHAEYIKTMESTARMSKEELVHLAEKFECISFCKTSFDYAKMVAAQLIDMSKDIVSGESGKCLQNAFALVRPPSHHAEHEMGASGYCLLNSTSMAVMNLLNTPDNGVNRVLIVDCDVHHGQGTQRMFYNRNDVLYISLHSFQRATFYPYLAESDIFHVGEEQGKGFNVNIAWDEPGMGDPEYMAAFLQIILPLAYSFSPDFVLILSGFDSAGGGDPEGDMNVSPACYAHMTHHLKALAQGKIMMVLEGGYSPEIVAECVESVVRVLLGFPPPMLDMTAEIKPSAVQTILDVIGVISDYWTCFQFQEDKSEDAKSYTEPCQKEEFRLQHSLCSLDVKTTAKFTCEMRNELESVRKIGYCFDARMLKHQNEDMDHPEKPERVAAINTRLTTTGLLDRCVLFHDKKVDVETLKLLHGENYLKAFKEVHKDDVYSAEKLEEYMSSNAINSTFHNKDTHLSAVYSAGCLVDLASVIAEDKKKITSGFANIRPPGHHAEVNKEYGFCFYNNVAVVAQQLLKKHSSKINRILILDWDVHHGNGTQHQFENTPNVLYVSLHRHGWFFPGGPDGGSDRVGTGPGEGFNVNMPWMVAEATDVEYIAAFTNVVLPIIYEYNPHIVLVSSGFDSAVGDPLGGQDVSPECYAHMTHMLMAFASGRIIIALEGGYNLQTIADCSEHCVRTLLREPCPKLPTEFKGAIVKPYHRTGILETIWHHRKYWKQLRFLKPVEEVSTVKFEDFSKGAADEVTENLPFSESNPPPKDTKESMLFWRKYWTEKFNN